MEDDEVGGGVGTVLPDGRHHQLRVEAGILGPEHQVQGDGCLLYTSSGRKPYQKYQNNDTEIVAGIGRAWTQPVGQDSGIGDAQGDQYPGEEGEQGKEPPLLFQRYPGLEIGDQRDVDAGGEPADQKLEGEEEDKVKLWNGTQKGRGQTKGCLLYTSRINPARAIHTL